MKKILCVLLSALMLSAAFTLTGCDKEATPLKFGAGVYTEVSKATDATDDKAGEGKIAITAAVLTVDVNGKIADCVLDTAEYTVTYTADGKAVANTDFATKYEKGDAYGMKAYGNAALEWYEQADAFAAVVCDKTLDEVKALVAEGDKGTDEVISAGCTIMVSDFVLAIEKAYNNAVESDVIVANDLKIGMYTEQSLKDATEDAPGQNKLETTVFFAAVDADDKVVDAACDCIPVAFTFDEAGASTFDLTKAVASKKEQGDAYGMKAYGGAALEWYEQAAAFDAACVGKTVAEIAGLVADDNYGSADLKAAGCTILVNGFVKASEKIG